MEKAHRYIARLELPALCVVYDSYRVIVSDSNIDVVYIATTHSHHYQHLMMALMSGKHVLCEKPLTDTANQAGALCDEARNRNRLLIEATWTRFLPITIDVISEIRRGIVGELLQFLVHTSFGNEGSKDA